MAFLDSLHKLLNRAGNTVHNDVVAPVQRAVQPPPGLPPSHPIQPPPGIPSPVVPFNINSHPNVTSTDILQSRALGAWPFGINNVAQGNLDTSNPSQQTPLIRLGVPAEATTRLRQNIVNSRPANFEGALPPKMINVPWSSHQVPYGTPQPKKYNSGY